MFVYVEAFPSVEGDGMLSGAMVAVVLRVCMAFHGENFPPPMKDHRLTLNRFGGETLTVRFSFLGETLTLTVEPFFAKNVFPKRSNWRGAMPFCFGGLPQASKSRGNVHHRF